MQINTYISTASDLTACLKVGVKEVLIEADLTGRFGTLSISEACSLAKTAREAGLRTVLVWDIFMSESRFRDTTAKLLGTDLEGFSAIRAADWGALFWLGTGPFKDRFNLHFIADQGCRNDAAVLAWAGESNRILGKQLDRIIVSPELSKEELLNTCRRVPAPIEILGGGPLCVSYTPRHVLDQEEGSDRLSSASLGNEKLRLLQNSHGTHLFLEEDYCILDLLVPLKQAGLHTVRLDFRLMQPQSSAAEILEGFGPFPELLFNGKAPWPTAFRRYFFEGNDTSDTARSDSRHDHDTDLLAKVVAAERGAYTAYVSLRDFPVDRICTLTSVDGKKREIAAGSFRAIEGSFLKEIEAGQLFYSPWIPGSTPGASLRYQLKLQARTE